MSRQMKNIALIILPIIYILLYKVIIMTKFINYAEIITSSFIFILLFISIIFLGYRKQKKTYNSDNIFRVVIFYLIFTFIIMYGLGFLTGFLRTSYSHKPLTIINNIFAPILIIIFTEIYRYVVVSANRDKKIFLWIYTIILIILELTITIRTIPGNDLESLFKITANIILPIIIKNGVLTYICYYAGYKVPIFYRLIMEIYTFIVPFVPDFGEYLQCLINITLPVLIYVHSFTIIDEREKKVEHIFVNNSINYLDIPIFVFVGIIVCLVSGIFPYYMIGIGSDSMNPKINKGDAVIIEKSDGKKEYKKNDIIAFEKSGRVIVHRIKEVTKKDGKLVYVTQGDANNTPDVNPVYKNKVKGLVKVKFPYIAWPTVLLSEYLHS